MVKYITKSGRNLYSGKITLRSYKYRLGDKIIEKEIVEHSDSVGLIPLDKNYTRQTISSSCPE